MGQKRIVERNFQPMKNENGRKCGTCIYRDNIQYQGNCNYLSIVGHSRGCKPTEYDKYKKGKAKRVIRPTIVKGR